MDKKIAVIGYTVLFKEFMLFVSSLSLDRFVLVNDIKTDIRSYVFSEIVYLDGFEELHDLDRIIYNVKLRTIK